MLYFNLVHKKIQYTQFWKILSVSWTAWQQITIHNDEANESQEKREQKTYASEWEKKLQKPEEQMFCW